MPVRNLLALVVLLLIVLGAGAWYSRSSPQPAPLLVDGAGTASAAITVHVSGEVLAPGLVEVAAGSRVADAVAAAGGTTRSADLAMVNLAASLQDGQQVVIPGVRGEGVSETGIAADGRVRINAATVAQLEELPGVGPVLAERIFSYRQENGPFATVEDLLDVPGIGEGKLETLRDSVALP